jgi:hypothetical protein
MGLLNSLGPNQQGTKLSMFGDADNGEDDD